MSLYVKIKKRLEEFTLDVEFEAEDEIFAVLGESGCGKSLTLKCIAGIEEPDEGQIVLNGNVLFDSERHIHLPARKRKVGYLFQDYALFPNMTVEENIGAGIRKAERKKQVSEYIKKFFLEGQEKKYPYMLSGGQKQRTALARMMIVNPEIILLDEPFSAVDSYLKWQLEQQILELYEQCRKTILFVSHNREEVYRLCDRMCILHHGKLEVVGEKESIFKNPKTVSAAMLTGCKNISNIEKKEEQRIFFRDWNFEKSVQRTDIGNCQNVGIRSRDIWITDEREADTSCVIERVIETPLERIYIVRTECAEKTLRLECSKDHSPRYQKGETLFLSFPEEKLFFLR